MSAKLQLPDGWIRKPIFEVAPIKGRLVDPKLDEYSKLILIAPDHVQQKTGQIISRKTAIEQAAISGKFLVQKNEVIYSKIRPYLMKAAIAQEACLCSADMYPLHCNNEIEPKYLHTILLSDRFTYYANSCSARTGIPKLNREDMGEYELSLPPLPEQRAIADLLSTWDEAIEKTERLIQAKEKRFKWLLRELISEPRNTQKDTKWKRVKLGEVCKVITSNVDKKTAPDEIPVHLCNYMDVYKNFYISNELNFMAASATSGEIEKYQLEIHDVLLTKDSETPDDIANSACVLDAPQNLLCGYHLAILRPKKNLFGPYLNFALHTAIIRYEFSRQANGATRFGLTMSAYNTVELPLPSIDEQKTIAEALTSTQQEIDLLKRLGDKYKTQKRGLMQKMLTGEWRVKPEIVNQHMEA